MTAINYKIVSRRVAGKPPPPKSRRNWRPVIAALEAGKVLLFPDDSLREEDVKYLRLALRRNGDKYRLTTRPTEHGRVIEAVRREP